MLTLADILEIENTPEILDFTCPGTDYLLWPRARTVVTRLVMESKIYGEGTLIKKASKQPWGKILGCLMEGVVHNLRFLNTQAGIVFFNSGVTNIKIDGKYFNRVSDYFAACFPDSTLLIEDHFEWSHPRPRANPNLIYYVPFVVTAALLAQLPFRSLDKTPVLEFIRFIDSRLRKLIGFQLTDHQKDLLLKVLVRYCNGLKPELHMYERLYRQLNPKLIFFEDGCYGNRGHIIRLAKEMGIKTAETQHGMISSGHDAYNYAPTIFQSDNYKKYLPDYFLSYGQWWIEQVRLPVEGVVIGNPHYDTLRQKLHPVSSPKNKILLLSDGLRFQIYFELAQSLKRGIKGGYEIMIRPHPIERTFALANFAQNDSGILIDTSENLYERLAESYAIIGEISTALFEAVGLVDKIFAWSSNITTFGLPDCPFEQFESVDELVAKLFLDNSGQSQLATATSVWASEWADNYGEFINQRIRLNG